MKKDIVFIIITGLFVFAFFSAFCVYRLTQGTIYADASAAITLASAQTEEAAEIAAAEAPISAAVNINTATSEELQTLDGIGPVIAQRIIDYRELYGAFISAEELLEVGGIGEKKLKKIRDNITF